MPSDVTLHDLRVDVQHLLARIDALGEIGRIDGPNGEWGNARLALTDADRAGRDLVVTWMRDLGLDVAIDAIGNVVATRQGSDPTLAPVMVGSHIDTVGTGGRFDGNLGVLAGLEVVETLARGDIPTRRPVQVAFFTDEEGARFAPDMLGSLVYVGGMPIEEALDVVAADDGARLGDELERIGYAGPVPCPASGGPPCLRRTPHRAGPDPRGRGRHDRRGGGRPGDLVDRDRHRRPVRSRRNHPDAPAPRRGVLRRCHCDVHP